MIDPKCKRLAVVIPFFQRDAGILRRAMMSVFAQKTSPNLSIHVVIIDDSSPLAPDGELSDLPASQTVTWSVHRQPNGGPGAARNRALDIISQDRFDYVAFLDSDDIWRPNHIAEALHVLAQGYGFYVCDNARDGAHDSYNNTVSALQDGGQALRPLASEILDKGQILGFKAGALGAAMIADCLCQPSAVVVTADTVRDLRFDVEQRTAGEDYLFWSNLALDGPPMAISWQCNVDCGRGVNIYFSAFDWEQARNLGPCWSPATFIRKAGRDCTRPKA